MDSLMKNIKQKVSAQPFTRRNFLSTTLKAGDAAFTTGLLPKLKANANCQYNVLFIMADDLRPLLGCYGNPEMHTPNIDRLAQRGTLFNRAYCQFPVCNASRTSMLTGLRPETTRVFSNRDRFRETLPNAVTLPQHFKAYGYHTQSIGKIFHNLAMQDDIYSWSVPSWGLPITNQGPSHPSWKAFEVEDDELSSGKTAKRTVEILQEIQNIHFFLAVGFHTPHLPFYAPKRYYDLYKNENFSFTSSSIYPNTNMRLFRDIPDEGPLSDAKALELIRAYAASISYMDAQIGRVLDRIDSLSLAENTVIVFAGDHGYHLGEHGKWGKNYLFEVSLRSPLIISVPGQTYQGVKTDVLTELVDIYPTLCEACQLSIPLQLEGLSLLPVIEQPTRPWKTAAFSRLGNNANSIRTQRYRYTEWGRNGSRGIELYDYDTDPDETVNRANLPENAELVADLSERLHAGWQAALPNLSEQIPVPQTLPWDINNDGVVDVSDMILVSSSFGMESPEPPKVDVNKDGNVDIIDLLLVAAHFGESCAPIAPSAHPNIRPEQLDMVEKWLAEAHLADDGSDIFRQGIATLEQLIRAAVPTETALLPNYPNPFNPETWIPYDLAKDANVHLHIYSAKGESVQQLSLGFQTAGTYRTRARAAYWNGRNDAGEPVASGIYFYTLQAGQFKATRRMVIMK
jgi:arylsulfatase A-like enzyme